MGISCDGIAVQSTDDPPADPHAGVDKPDEHEMEVAPDHRAVSVRAAERCRPGEMRDEEGQNDMRGSCSICEAGNYCSEGEVTPCPTGTYCSAGSSAPTPCEPGKWDHDADPSTVCAEHSPCRVTEYELAKPTTVSDRECSAVTACLLGQELIAAATETSDTTCRECSAAEFCAGGNALPIACPTGTVIPATDQRPAICVLYHHTLTGDAGQSCALGSAGNVLCWGNNERGELGTSTRLFANSTPVQVNELDGVDSSGSALEISTGNYHGCAVLEDGAVRCWGMNKHGQLGDGSTEARAAPTVVSGIGAGEIQGRALSVSSGGSTSCALLESGAVGCWGYNASGELGDNSGIASPSLQLIPGIDGKSLNATAVQLSLGWHACVILGDKTMKCWGRNSDGQLGNGQQVSSHLPVAVVGLDGADEISTPLHVSAGVDHTCAIVGNGTVRCWGGNDEGQLGNGTRKRNNIPTTVVGIDGTSAERTAAQVTAGRQFTCALLKDGTVSCWGMARTGVLGADLDTPSSRPVTISHFDGLTPATTAIELTAGEDHACARLANDDIRCWGSNAAGQVGGSNFWRIEEAVGLGTEGVIGVSAGRGHTCEVLATGQVHCRGRYDYGTGYYGPSVFDGLSESTTAIATASGDHYTCALALNGAVKCWGDNFGGMLGGAGLPYSVGGLDGSTPNSSARQLDSGPGHSCVTLETGGVGCWGKNSAGQLGSDTGGMQSPFLPIDMFDGETPETTAESVTTGGYHSCALLKSGGTVCWGSNSSGQLGDGSDASSLAPVHVMGLEGGTPSTQAVSIAAGNFQTCAALADGTVRCWGGNGYGDLGDGTGEDSWVPVPVDGIDGLSPATTAVEVGAVSRQTCARFLDGTIKCWGHNWRNSLDYAAEIAYLSPVQIPGFDGLRPETTAVALALGPAHDCALVADGTSRCWGSNTSSQITGNYIYTYPNLVVF